MHVRDYVSVGVCISLTASEQTMLQDAEYGNYSSINYMDLVIMQRQTFDKKGDSATAATTVGWRRRSTDVLLFLRMRILIY